MLSDIVETTAIDADGVRLETLPAFGRLNFRGRAGAVAAMSEAFGLALPEASCRAAIAGSRAALWLGPDEWLLLMLPTETDAVIAAAASALAGLPHSLVDISERQYALGLSGRLAATVLAGGNPLDFDLSTFPVGMCTRTIMGKAELAIWRTEPDRFHIEVWRSFAPYIRGFLREHMREFGA
ncbi:sarcosine oxidase subunit gamma [Acidisoma cellulosilytica]|uniref:Sarcosine oxidase subunit gamma n=1 Tax=Acidisoma cellulosilyticum TaxID=2802395 RepID=A0A964E5C3_9PROT|nr:sarcosine oxidase subunit gamma family protein [Acidisoma cellulosilyticum]MCB8881823.1 sarcosine oxidase subunit gamma [Acidisoma cellulosilyticum]